MNAINKEAAKSIELLEAGFKNLLEEFSRIDSELRELRRIVHGSEIRPGLLDSIAAPNQDESDDAWFDRMSDELSAYMSRESAQ